MPNDTARRASALIERIQTTYHDRHRESLPPLLAMAAALEARGLAEGITAELRAIGDALEQHMFKEEMRLFPMMEQGGNTLIVQLMDDLHREHDEHSTALHTWSANLAMLTPPPDGQAGLQALRDATQALLAELEEHIRTENDELFPMFEPGARARTA
jgi:regulator of cell morphogenesis and NO signaling